MGLCSLWVWLVLVLHVSRVVSRLGERLELSFRRGHPHRRTAPSQALGGSLVLDKVGEPFRERTTRTHD